MHDNTMTTQNGKPPAMGGNAASIWNLHMMLTIFFNTSMYLP